ncbi:retron Ec67 family RNA-directed DNA polymerase/endonuclease [Bacillus paralicheniformis]|uniref:retron Ec67 family RNA-directed DNA polymerase/endonuclease n=2 Tax=Bacillus paralicheniformis TaxID=1648923 RepID=UPI002DBEB03E|nr:retron Ec67 family RNA-directed DNA polymerase/endonuclease [Bacillus paralicheniformis]MEC0578518.1 retron Ec67 family RNA-directed DNA polymerase/endonuclease [Bacillus paralicheniformis]
MKTFENIKTLDDLSMILKIPKKKLTYMLYILKPDNAYTSFKILKKSGGERIINTPSNDLKDIQRSIVEILWRQQKILWEEHKIKSNISHAFVKKKSILTNARVHKNKRYVFNIDLEDFFDSFHFGRVRGFFEKNKDFLFPQKIATTLAQLTCYNGCLPQGAPTSPIITNLICNILDMRLLKVAKEFKLDYTRYADDLTFSTNDEKFVENLEGFKTKAKKVINSSGFKINEKKTRLQHKNSRQVVTGLVVNKKVNVNREFYKETRSMANTLYKKGEFEINGKNATINQLEGRFAFINQIDRFNNGIYKNDKAPLKLCDLNSKEKQYQMFLFYKYFFGNSKPCIITEGKTDIVYIQSALKNLYEYYPNLVKKKADGTYQFKITFLKRSKRLRYFLDLQLDGADTMIKLHNFYCNTNNDSFPNYPEKFKELGTIPKNPVIFVLDNELENNNKPLRKLIKNVRLDRDSSKYDSFKKKCHTNIKSNLYLSTHQLVKGLQECEIEDLFDDNTLNTVIRDKTFERDSKKYSDEKNYGKAAFADYISKNYRDIDFKEFKPLLDNINEIITTYSLA